MPVTETGYLRIADRVAEFGLHVRANGFAILPTISLWQFGEAATGCVGN